MDNNRPINGSVSSIFDADATRKQEPYYGNYNYKNQPVNSPSYTPPVSRQSSSNDRTGMSNKVWENTLKISEILVDVIKAFMVVGGILAANLADVIFGAAGITILFGGSSVIFNGLPVWIIATIISMGASSIQIFLWSLIQKRNIGFSDILKWKKLPSDIKGFLSMALVVWIFDTLIDMSPIALLVQNSQFQSVTWLYWAMVISVSVIVLLLCGFSEVMTSNMRGMLLGNSENKPKQTECTKKNSVMDNLPKIRK